MARTILRPETNTMMFSMLEWERRYEKRRDKPRSKWLQEVKEDQNYQPEKEIEFKKENED